MNQVRSLLRWLLFFVCGWCAGCGSSVDGHKTVDLAPPANVIVKDASLLTATVPAGMTIVRSIPVRSQFEVPLTNLLVKSSCGCTSAELDKDVILPGETKFLRCVYDGGLVARSRDVNIRIFSPDAPADSFIVHLQFQTVRDQPNMAVSAMPHEIAIDQLWEEHSTRDYEFALNIGEKIPRKSIRLEPSASFIKSRLEGTSLIATIDSPPVGKLDAAIVMSFPFENDSYACKIPITGRVRPPMSATPGFLNFGEVARGSDMLGEIKINVEKSNGDNPKVELQGDWKIESLDRASEKSWKLRVRLKELAGNDIRYGQIFVKSNWQGEPIKIPITGTIVKNTK